MAIGPSDKLLHASLIACRLEDKFDKIFTKEYIGYGSIKIGTDVETISDYIKSDVTEMLAQNYMEVGWYYVTIESNGKSWYLTLIKDEKSYDEYVKNGYITEFTILSC